MDRVMITMFVRHTVPDFATWKKVMDEFAPIFKAYHVIGTTIYRSVDDPNDITVTHEFETIEAAHQFAKSDELHAERPRAGVEGDPMVWFATTF